MKLYYFGYGSNICTGRLRERVPSARPVFIYKLQGHVLRFHKRSDKDGSGKADAAETGNAEDFVWGVVFEMDSVEKPRLDAAEGLGKGYTEKEINVVDCAGQAYTALMYGAENSYISPTLRPYSWYKRFIVEGAKRHGLPPEYVERLEAVPADEDPNRDRDGRKRRIACD